MLRSNRPLRKGLLLIMMVIFAGAWLMTVMPALAQGDAAQEPSMLDRFFDQPDLVAPLAVPMVLALGGIVTLMAFLAWVFSRLPQNS